MSLIAVYPALLVGFFIIGIIAAACQHTDKQNNDASEDNGDDDEYSSPIVISQEIPSVFETFHSKHNSDK